MLKKNELMRKALNIGTKHVVGESFNQDLQDEKKMTAEDKLEKLERHPLDHRNRGDEKNNRNDQRHNDRKYNDRNDRRQDDRYANTRYDARYRDRRNDGDRDRRK